MTMTPKERREKYRAYNKTYYKAWYEANKKKRRKRNKAWREANKEKLRACNKAYNEANKKRRRAYNKAWNKKRYHNNLNFRILSTLRSRLRGALKGELKSARTMILIGCSIEELKAHIERQFRPGMTWDNWGNGEGFWNIDHIRPCASFDLRDHTQQRQCFHWTNLQPLWAIDNFIKNDAWEAA